MDSHYEKNNVAQTEPINRFNLYQYAECSKPDVDRAVFFPNKNTARTDYERRVATAKEICARCIGREVCLEIGIAEKHDGIWGGMTEKERRLYNRSRNSK